MKIVKRDEYMAHVKSLPVDGMDQRVTHTCARSVHQDIVTQGERLGDVVAQAMYTKVGEGERCIVTYWISEWKRA